MVNDNTPRSAQPIPSVETVARMLVVIDYLLQGRIHDAQVAADTLIADGSVKL